MIYGSIDSCTSQIGPKILVDVVLGVKISGKEGEVQRYEKEKLTFHHRSELAQG